MAIAIGTKVKHKHHRELGIGEVKFLEPIAGVTKCYVSWPAKPASLDSHTESELEAIRELADRMKPGDVGPASFTPFTLRVLGRWFEARHALTGELSNQPFQMLPHQVVVTNRVVTSDANKRNWLIADDVGLGKTIEAGMIMEVLRKRSLGRFRCLFITPAGLKTQWIEEMRLRFGRRVKEFDSRYPNDLEDSDLLVASIDTLKTKKFEQALRTATPWDLVIVDEAHHLATVTDVLKYKVVKLLRDEGLARNFLFLTATPHSGQSKHFWNMLRLLREDIFPTEDTVTLGDGRLNKVMIRNRKSDVTDARGRKIFNGIEPAKILTCAPTSEEVAFYEALLDYVRLGYGVADRLKSEKDATANAVGFLMSTFRKLASSSRAAIENALRNRLRYLESEGAPPEQTPDEAADERFEGEREERDAVRAALNPESAKKGKKRAPSPIENEIAEVRGLLQLLEKLEGRDSKLAFFLDQVKKLTDPHPDLKLYQRAVTEGEQVARAEIDKQSRQIESIMRDPKGMLGLFKGLKRFDITDYQRAAAKVSTEHLDYFVRKYLGEQGQAIRATADGLYSFGVPKALPAVAARLPVEDRYEARESLKEAKVDRATVDKEKAQSSLGCRLLRFGDVVFDAMVRHVQDSDFSEGVATLSVPAAVLGWRPEQQGVCALFDLKVLRQEGTTGARVLREELVAYSVPRGGPAAPAEPFLEALHQTRTGPVEVDPVEARRAHAAARGQAEARLRAMHEEVVAEFGTSEAIVVQLDDFALAWVAANG
jgi:hypothetical protein